ncbi:hypothetical protein PsYK624_129680 [Phanerochaete sordida]|uniref:Uncharacterized protein n=1 Tax=Phanerochaete sordida TaxID=48140 RepID=A0A9P3LK09_9APHY|nr:hypothetical protein PsYK624_129680 [Phanerochaete sordida]
MRCFQNDGSYSSVDLARNRNCSLRPGGARLADGAVVTVPSGYTAPGRLRQAYVSPRQDVASVPEAGASDSNVISPAGNMPNAVN